MPPRRFKPTAALQRGIAGKFGDPSVAKQALSDGAQAKVSVVFPHRVPQKIRRRHVTFGGEHAGDASIKIPPTIAAAGTSEAEMCRWKERVFTDFILFLQ